MLGERIRQIRLARGLSLRKLAEKAGCVSAQAISNYENDRDFPDSKVLVSLANALDVPVSSFFQRIKVDLGEPAYRKCSVLSHKKDRYALESNVSIQVERYLEIESILGMDTSRSLDLPPSFNEPIREVAEAENRANDLRIHWNLSDYPIENLVELLEEKGILVVSVSADERFDGCTYPNAQRPIIVVNTNRPGDRFRFNLAHELGHMVLKFPEDWTEAEQEKAAHRFAGAFLVPASRVMDELGNKRTHITIRELCELKMKYGMSVQAWIHRARDLEVLSENAYRNLWKILNERGYRKKEIGNPYPLEQTTRYTRLVARAYSEGRISESRAAELLDIDVLDLDRYLSLTEPSGSPGCVNGQPGQH